MSKYYLVYLNNNFVPRTDITISDLYGYTDSKQLIRKFKSQRNMSKFKILKKELTSYDLHEIHDINAVGYLELINCNTKSIDYGVNDAVDIVMTHGERTYITRMCQGVLFSELWTYVESSPYILKSKYFDALKSIAYVGGYNMLHMTSKTPKSLCYSPVEGDLDIDLLNSFLYHFGDMLI